MHATNNARDFARRIRFLPWSCENVRGSMRPRRQFKLAAVYSLSITDVTQSLSQIEQGNPGAAATSPDAPNAIRRPLRKPGPALIITSAIGGTASRERMNSCRPFQPKGWLGWSRIVAGLAGQLGLRDMVFQPNLVSRPPSRITNLACIGPTPATPSVGC